MKNDFLVPRRLEERKIRLRQNNLRLLQQETIADDLEINKSFFNWLSKLNFREEILKHKK